MPGAEKNVDQSGPVAQVLVIGSGFGGLGMAIKLKQAGIDDFLLFEKAGSVAGTWRDNTYPGAACDIQSHLYSYSFAPKYDWSRKFAPQPEIRTYIQECAEKYRILSHIRFHKEVRSAAFDEARGIWTVYTTDGLSQQCRMLVSATGQLNRPRTPRLTGIEDFKGKVFHSARWEHDYCLDGRTVAVLGSGASVIQFVPRIAGQVKSLTLFQRSAAWVLPKSDRTFTPFEQRLFKQFPSWARLYRLATYLKNESRAIAFTRYGGLLKIVGGKARWMLWREVRDPEKRHRLTPDYPIGCKRILISNEWYKTMDLDHVQVVTGGISHVEPEAIVTSDGQRHRVDTIIFGTGFDATDFLAPMTVKGINGRELNEAWRNGAEAYKGISVSGFPNFFILYGPNTNLAHNSIVYMLEAQASYVLQAVRKLLEPGVLSIDVRPERQQAYVAMTQNALKFSVWAEDCHSWYKTASGKNVTNWPGFTFTFKRLMQQFDSDDYVLTTRATSCRPR